MRKLTAVTQDEIEGIFNVNLTLSDLKRMRFQTTNKGILVTLQKDTTPSKDLKRLLKDLGKDYKIEALNPDDLNGVYGFLIKD